MALLIVLLTCCVSNNLFSSSKKNNIMRLYMFYNKHQSECNHNCCLVDHYWGIDFHMGQNLGMHGGPRKQNLCEFVTYSVVFVAAAVYMMLFLTFLVIFLL
jgi:hypothetical protein